MCRQCRHVTFGHSLQLFGLGLAPASKVHSYILLKTIKSLTFCVIQKNDFKSATNYLTHMTGTQISFVIFSSINVLHITT